MFNNKIKFQVWWQRNMFTDKLRFIGFLLMSIFTESSHQTVTAAVDDLIKDRLYCSLLLKYTFIYVRLNLRNLLRMQSLQKLIHQVTTVYLQTANIGEVRNVNKSLTNSSLYYCITNSSCLSEGKLKMNVEILPTASSSRIIHFPS